MLFAQTGKNLRDTQAFIPPKEKVNSRMIQMCSHDIQKLTKFDPDRISAEDYEEFISFIETIWNTPSSGLIPKRFCLDNALEVLHKSDYNLIRAKFWIQFPLLYKMEYTPESEEHKGKNGW